ncbi:digeranylgeranylglycerophospholipid reductase [Sulfodiicoccus acidiphilus]|nr:digeranylgeranylglycerophospholipid reductase [Sulfodiicoccus acidiphilus]
MKESSYDVLIVGGGFAGSTTAWFLSNRGYRVLLIDSKPWNRIGDKPCGDAVSKDHFDDLGMPYPQGEELEQTVQGIKIYSPDMKTVWTVKGEGFELNAPAYNQRILKEALKRGVEVMDMTTASSPILEGGRMKGAVIFNRRTNETIRVEAKVTVDATGNARSLRMKLPPGIPVTEDLDDKDADVAYREEAITAEPIEDPHFLRIFVSQRAAPGGYWWYFPKGEQKVNVGLGIQGGMGYGSVHEYYRKYLGVYAPDVKEVVLRGGALVPTRRPLTSLVWDGMVVVGDSAFTVNPVHGGGKGSAMISGFCAAKAIMKAMEVGDFSKQTLWDMNLCYVSKYGQKQASLELFRKFLQKLPDEDIDFGMRKGLIKEEDLVEVSVKGTLKLSVAEKAIRLISGLSRPSLLMKLKTVASYMTKVKEVYNNYPTTFSELERWKAALNDMYAQFDAALDQ